MALRMNPMTGKAEFIEESPVINETTGQTQTTVQEPVSLQEPVVTTPPQESLGVDITRGQDVTAVDESRTTSSVMDFLKQTQDASQAVQNFQFVTPKIQNLQSILGNIQTERDVLTNEQLTADERTLRAIAEAEQRQVDIGTIGGQQAQIQRIAGLGTSERGLRDRDLAIRQGAAARELGVLVDNQRLQLEALQAQVGFSQQNLQNFITVSEYLKANAGNDIDQAARQAAILGAISSGVADPASIFQAVNFDEAGNRVGDIQLSEIKDVLSLIAQEGEISALDLAKLDLERAKFAQSASLADRKLEFDKYRFEREQELKNSGISSTGAKQITELESEIETARLVSRLVDDVFGFGNPEAIQPYTYKDFVGNVEGRVPNFLSQEATDFDALVEQLKNNLTLGNLGLMSGVLSETDIKILESAASKLKRTLSDDAFTKELNTIKNTFTSKIIEAENKKNQLQVDYSSQEVDEFNTIYNQSTGGSGQVINGSLYYP